MLKHIVLFQLKPELSAEQRQTVMENFKQGMILQIIKFAVGGVLVFDFFSFLQKCLVIRWGREEEKGEKGEWAVSSESLLPARPDANSFLCFLSQ